MKLLPPSNPLQYVSQGEKEKIATPNLLYDDPTVYYIKLFFFQRCALYLLTIYTSLNRRLKAKLRRLHVMN